MDREASVITITVRRLLAGTAILLGALAAIAGNPYPKENDVTALSRHPEPPRDQWLHSNGERRGTPYEQAGRAADQMAVDIDRLATAVAHEEDHVTALELATWIRARKPGLRVIDLRSAAEFDEYHLPRAEPIPLESLTKTRFHPDETIVLISVGGAHAAQAWVFLEALGHRQVYFLRGGLQEWLEDVMNPALAADASPAEAQAFANVAELSRYFGGVPRVGVTPRKQETKSSVVAIRRRGC
jgi:rhodanese-related sulfurtransferase